MIFALADSFLWCIFHGAGENIHLLGGQKALDGFPAGKGLEAEFRHIAEEIFPVFCEGNASVPYILSNGRLPGSRRLVRQRRLRRRETRASKRYPDRKASECGDNILIKPYVVGLCVVVSLISEGFREEFHLIVSAPEAQRGVVAKPW